MSILIHTFDGNYFALEPKPGDTLARTIFMSRLWHGVPLCSGLSKCGLCRVRYLKEAPEAGRDEIRKLGEEAVAEGWRLSCLHPSESCEIELPEPKRTQRAIKGHTTTTGDFNLAIDLGTTSIHWSALSGSECVASGHELNPQIGMGSEVMSRLAAASTAEGRFVLRALVTDRLVELMQIAQNNMGGDCTGLAVSGNPAMTYILLGKKPDDLASAPYTLSYTGGDEKRLGASLPAAYIAPLLAPFVGADISAGLTAIEYGGKPNYPFLLADLGTNGEFVLALSPTERLCASVPMGPALEGVGLSFGRTAGPGAITSFTLTPQGLAATLFDESPTEPDGMTGTGYLSLASILLQNGVLDESGHFGKGSTPLAAKLAENVSDESGEPAFELGYDLRLPASDMEELLKVKAAFNLATAALLKKAGIGPSGLAEVHIAGALGEHVSLNDLEALGFLPPGLKSRTIKAGNTSLKGTELLLIDPEAKRFAETLPESVTLLDLTGDESFGEQFLQRMCLRYVD